MLRFDYRGIGGSLRGALRESDATMHAWGEQDPFWSDARSWLLSQAQSQAAA